jgi:hypothetical protein
MTHRRRADIEGQNPETAALSACTLSMPRFRPWERDNSRRQTWQEVSPIERHDVSDGKVCNLG